jgi:quercetin dioxygenase-like cupin family protein
MKSITNFLKLFFLIAFAILSMNISAEEVEKGITRTTITTVDSPENKQITIVQKVHFKPNALMPAHTHPGVEVLCICNGELKLTANGSEKVYKMHDCAINPVGISHSGKSGAKGLDMIATYIVNRGEPIIKLSH